MNSSELDNLVAIGSLKRAPPSQAEIGALVGSARARLEDARSGGLAIESRFDLAYNAAHGFALAALRIHGYRSGNRYIVFQVLPHTAGIDPVIWRVLSKAHDERNLMEYEGGGHISARLLDDLISAATIVEAKVMDLLR